MVHHTNQKKLSVDGSW